eukprot:364741-Chlamydomonas_euryale.AAC.13
MPVSAPTLLTWHGLNCAELVTEMFTEFGSVRVVRIAAKEGKSKLPSWLTVSLETRSGVMRTLACRCCNCMSAAEPVALTPAGTPP